MRKESNSTKHSSQLASGEKRGASCPQATTTESEEVATESTISDIPETELDARSTLTHPTSTRSVNTSANRLTRSNDVRKVAPLVEELPCRRPQNEEIKRIATTEDSEVRVLDEEESSSEHGVGAHKIQGPNIGTEEQILRNSRDVSRASSANDIVIPNAHVVEDDAVTAYVIEPSSIVYGNSSEKPPMDEEAACFSCVCPCMSCKVKTDSKRRRASLLCVAVSFIILALLAIFIALAATGRFRPDPPPPDQDELRNLIANTSPDGGISLNDTRSYQHAAFSWLLEDPRLSGFSTSQLIERYALACLYNSLNGDRWKENDGWVAHGRSVCDWYNVTCAAWPNISSISLIRNNLRGNIFAPELVMLQSLKVLEFEGNFMFAKIPEELGNLASLEQLLLRNNSLQGSIPSALAKLSSLQYLKLHRNDFTGHIPTALSSMDSLIYLTLGDNALTSTIPFELSQMKNLQVLKLYQNGLTSTIPSELGLMSNLHSLDLDRNRLESTIPTELGDLKYLERLRLHGNKLVGSVPASICDLTNDIIVDCTLNCTCCRKCK